LWEKFGVAPTVAAETPVADAGLQQSSNKPPVEGIDR